MANLKSITELPVVESAEGLNLIVNDNGSAKQIAASAVGRIKTVNGTQPDDDGNIQIDTASSWNDLKDKPFYEEQNITLEVEGVPDEYGNYEGLKTSIVAGKEYTFFIDDVEYSNTAYFDDTDVCVVLLALNSAGETVAWLNKNYISLNPDAFDLSVSHKIEMLEEPIVHKIDAKYLPVEEWDIDVNITQSFDSEGNTSIEYIVNDNKSFEEIKNKLVSGLPLNNKVTFAQFLFPEATVPVYSACNVFCVYFPVGAEGEGSEEFIGFTMYGMNGEVNLMLLPDGTIVQD